MHLLNKFLVSGLFMALITTASRADAPADTLAKIRATGEIALGHRDAAIPFSDLVDGKPQGYTVVMCQELVKRLQTRLALTPVIVKDNAAAFAALEQGQAEAWITDDILLAAYRAGAKDPKRFTLLSKRHTIEPLALTLRKNDLPFEQAVDAEMKALYREGRATALYRRWFMQAIAPKGVVLDVPPSRLLRGTFRQPQKVEMDTDVVVL